MRVQAVILDVGGVFLVPHFATVARSLSEFGVALDEPGAERAHYYGVRALDTTSDEDRHAYMRAYVRGAGVVAEDESEAAEKVRQAWTRPNIDVWSQHVRGSRAGLRVLAETGVKLGIISNSDGTVEEQLRRGEICQVGEGLGVPVLAIIDSGVVGVAKPAAEIFSHALDPLGVAPSDALYVGDSVRYDVAGARAAGLVPVHFDPYGLCPQPDDHGHVRAVADVVQLL